MTGKNPHESIARLLHIMQVLRSEQGCPWDAQQTPESLAPYILEEACELVDAVEGGAPELILDELGDLLLQVVFQAQIFSERRQFDFDDVAAGIADKLVRRHPHVFAAGDHGASIDQLAIQWDTIKRAEASHNKTGLADHLPANLPALQRAQKLVARAERAGRQGELPHEDSRQALAEFSDAGVGQGGRYNEETLGLALFQLVRIAQAGNLDAEAALRKTTRRITRHLDRQ